jgi:hypothetical protein
MIQANPYQMNRKYPQWFAYQGDFIVNLQWLKLSVPVEKLMVLGQSEAGGLTQGSKSGKETSEWENYLHCYGAR